VAAFTDRQASKQLAGNIEKLAACQASGMPLSRNLTEAIDRLPERILNSLRSCGLLDSSQTAGARPLEKHLDGWKKHLTAKGDTEKHIKQRKARIERLLKAADARWWSDLTPEKVETALTGLRQENDLSVSTVNAYQSAIKQFTCWMYRNGHAPENPLRHLSRQNPEPHRRRKRRALSNQEAGALLESARKSKKPLQGASPKTRWLLYRMALETGLRFGELKTLKVGALNLNGTPPTVHIEAAYSKSGKGARLPLRKPLAEDLAEHCSGRDPGDNVFDMWKTAVGARMIKGDLKASGDKENNINPVPYKDKRGRVADFHALRHTFITNLARSGVHPKTAQALARHSTMELTMQVYTLVAMDTKEEAVNSLPSFDSVKKVMVG
jgi:integrase